MREKKILIKKNNLESKQAKQVVLGIIERTSDAVKVDAGTLISAVNSALKGDRTKLYNLFENLLRFDPVLSDAVDKLTQSVTNAEITFQVKGESVEEIDDLIDTTEFETFIREIALKFIWGKSVIETSFSPDFSVFSIPRKNIRIANMDKPLKDRIKYIATKESDRSGYEYTQDEFIIECGDDNDLGLLLRASLFAIYKRGGWGDWAQFVEQFAMPFLTAEYEGFDENTRLNLFKALGSIGSGKHAAVPKGVNLQVHDSNVSGSSQTFDTFEDKCDKQILIALLGNTMTTIDGSSRSQADVHQDTQEQRFKAIRRYVQRVLNRHFVPLLIKRGYNVQGGFFSFPDQGESISTKERLDMALQIKSAGIPVDNDYIYEITGIPKADTSDTKEEKEEQPTEEQPKVKEEEKSDEATKKTDSEKEIKNSDDDPQIKLSAWRNITDFFVNAPTVWSGAIQNFSKRLKRHITGKITLADDYSIDIDKLINQAIREVYGNKGEELLNKNLFEATNKPLQHAVDTELKGMIKENPEFVKAFKESTAVFSAFKNHQQTKLFAEALKDENGKIRPFYKFRKECLKIGEKFNDEYLRTEYNTLIRSLRVTANLKKYEKTLHLYPNLEYIETNSQNPRKTHLKYVGLVLDFYDMIWAWLMPPSEWNCDCSVRPTDKEVTQEADRPVKPKDFDPVFNNRPDLSASFVNIEETPYYKHTAKESRKEIKEQAVKFLNDPEPEKEVYKGKKGGYLEIVKQNGNEREKNLKTYTMLADRGGKYTLLNESKIEGAKNPDAFNYKSGEFSDAKHPITENGKNAIQTSIKAAGKQKVGEVVIRLENEYSSKDLHEGFKSALQGDRAEELRTIILFRKGKEPLYLDVAKLRKRFSKKK